MRIVVICARECDKSPDEIATHRVSFTVLCYSLYTTLCRPATGRRINQPPNRRSFRYICFDRLVVVVATKRDDERVVAQGVEGRSSPPPSPPPDKRTPVNGREHLAVSSRDRTAVTCSRCRRDRWLVKTLPWLENNPHRADLEFSRRGDRVKYCTLYESL